MKTWLLFLYFKAFVSVMGVDGIETNVCYKKKILLLCYELLEI